MCNELPEASELSPDGTEQHHEHGVACSAHCISYVHLRKDALL